MKKGWWIGKMVVLGMLFVTVMGVVTMYLWNWLVPVLFSGPIINFWQALGLVALSKILFGFGGKGGHSRSHAWKSEFKQKWMDKYSHMSPQDREKLKQKFKDKWCAWEESPVTKSANTQQNISEEKL